MAPPGHNHSVRIAEHQSIPRQLEKARKCTSFVWAPFVNATNSPQNCNTGLVRHSVGSMISARYDGSKNNPLSRPAALLATIRELALSGHSKFRDQCRYWGRSGHRAGVEECLLMTQSGHICSHVRLPLRGDVAGSWSFRLN